MSLRDFLIMALVCLAWAVNTIISAQIVGGFGLPPLAYAAIRYAAAALLLLPLLGRLPKPGWRSAPAMLLVAGLHFGLLFIGLQTASASNAAITLQLTSPVTIVFAALFLKERPGMLRIAGVAIALVGVVITAWRPGQMAVSVGLFWVFLAVLALAGGTLMLKTVERVNPLRIQAWAALLSTPLLTVASLVGEGGQWSALRAHPLAIAAAVAFSALVVICVATSAFYGLVQKYDGNLIASLTLMMPVMTLAIESILARQLPGAPLLFGAVLTLAGVLLIAARPGRAISGKAGSPVTKGQSA